MNLLSLVLAAATLTDERPPPEREPPRLSAEAAPWAAITPSAFSVGVSLHVGVHVNDHLAFYLLGQGGPLRPMGIGSAVIEYQFLPEYGLATLSLATGAGLLVAQKHASSSDLIIAPGAPLRLIAGIGRHEQLFLALDGFVGVDVKNEAPRVATALGLSLGYRVR